MSAPRSIPDRLQHIAWPIVGVLAALTGIGLTLLYSVAGGNWAPWASNQAIRFLAILPLMLAIAALDLRRLLAVAYPALLACLLLLVVVAVLGHTAGGAQSWLNLGFIRLQPSELTKIALVLALARYYHQLARVHVNDAHRLIPALVLVGVPTLVVLVQPDLGTAVLMLAASAAVMFLAGLNKWWFIGSFGAVAAAGPLAWPFLLPHQKNRVLTFLNPERDPLGAGYHITQSKIAIGSGGLLGKGYLEGTQSHLKFLPEIQTDFIFAVLVEEWGWIGGVLLLALYGILIGWSLWVAVTAQSQFGRLVAAGLSATIFCYVGVNMGMVTGLLPVVGIPLPMVSYGGSSMLTMMIATGLLLNIALNRDDPLSERTRPA